jgi:hypothetical protein
MVRKAIKSSTIRLNPEARKAISPPFEPTSGIYYAKIGSIRTGGKAYKVDLSQGFVLHTGPLATGTVNIEGASEGIDHHIEAAIEAAIIDRAAEVVGDRVDAMRWLGTPVRALNYATPISLLHDFKGREQVLTVLGRLESGVL